LFKCGESDSGRKLKVTLKEYIEYALYGRDDSPLYMFEACLEEHPEAKQMMDDYKPAHVFKEDLFTELVGQTLFTVFIAWRKKQSTPQMVLNWTKAIRQRGSLGSFRDQRLEHFNSREKALDFDSTWRRDYERFCARKSLAPKTRG
jgi:hypothetical protein